MKRRQSALPGARRLAQLAAALTVSAATLVTPTTAQASTGMSPCLNYADQQTWGTFYADTRYTSTDPIALVSWLWSINVVSDRAGAYSWQTFINGKPVPGASGDTVKDDNLHSALPHYMNGQPVYTYGDTFHVEAIHEAANGQLYVAVDNQCYVASHV